MQIKRMFGLFSLAVIAAIVLVACGVSTQQQGGGTASNPTAAPAAGGGAASGSAATIKWRTRYSDAAEQKVYEELNQIVNDKLGSKNIKAVYDAGANQGYFEKLKTEIAAGNAPDIFWIGGVELADFVATGSILDLKPLIDKDTSFKIDDFYPNVISELSRDGKIYGLPRDISTMVVYYNEDLFKAAGLQTPKELAAAGKWNLDALLESSKKLTDASKQQYGLGFGDWWGPDGYFIYSAGGSYYNADKSACGLNTPEAIAGATYVSNLFKDKLIVPGDADGEALFNAGKVGMYFNGRWFAPGVRTNAKFNWDVAVMPEGKAKSTWLFWGPYLVNAKTVSPDAAWEVLKVLTSAEATGKVAALGTNIPPRKDQAAVDAFLKATPPANNQAYLDGVSYAALESPLWTGSWADYSSGFGKLWSQMTAGKITPEEFGKQACETTTAAFKK